MVERAQVTTQKDINPEQLKAEMGCDVFTSEAGIVQAEVEEATLQAAVDAHTADPGWRAPGPERDWRTLIENEVAYIADQLSSWPTNANTNTEALQRVNFLLGATKRLARNQERILKYIRDQVMDAEA